MVERTQGVTWWELRSSSLWAFMVVSFPSLWSQEAEKCFYWCVQCIGRTALGHEMPNSLPGAPGCIPVWTRSGPCQAVCAEGELWRCVLPQTCMVRWAPPEGSSEWSRGLLRVSSHSHPCVCSDLPCLPSHCIPVYPVSSFGTSVKALSPNVGVC